MLQVHPAMRTFPDPITPILFIDAELSVPLTVLDKKRLVEHWRRVVAFLRSMVQRGVLTNSAWWEGRFGLAG